LTDLLSLSFLAGLAIFGIIIALKYDTAEKPKKYILTPKKTKPGSVEYLLSVLNINRSEYYLGTGMLAAAGAGLGILLKNPLASVMLALFAVIYRKKKLHEKFMQRKAMIDTQVDTALQMIASLHETTGDLIYSIEGAAKTTASPMRDELIQTVKEYRAGKSLLEALRGLAERTENRDLEVFVRAVAISEEYGTNTSEVIIDTSKVISDRIVLREEIKNELRGQKLTTTIFLIFLPLTAAGVIGFYDEARHILTNTFMGKVVLDVVILLNFIAWYFSGAQRLVDEL